MSSVLLFEGETYGLQLLLHLLNTFGIFNISILQRSFYFYCLCVMMDKLLPISDSLKVNIRIYKIKIYVSTATAAKKDNVMIFIFKLLHVILVNM